MITLILKSSPGDRGKGETRVRSEHEEGAQLTRRGPPDLVLGTKWDESIKALDVQIHCVTQTGLIAELFSTNFSLTRRIINET